MAVLVTSDDCEDLPDDIEKDHWVGEGFLKFKVISYDKSSSYMPYEIEIIEYSGCLGGLEETMGIEYAVNEGILDVGNLHIGCTYLVQGVSADFTRGDGWTTDDDVEYSVESVTQYVTLHEFMSAWWWHLIGHRIRNWRNKWKEKNQNA